MATDPPASTDPHAPQPGSTTGDPDRPVPPLPTELPPPVRHCRNCGHRLAPGDRFCGGCRQKYSDRPPSLRDLFTDFFETVFNIDNRVIRSLLAVFVPGRLTIHYMRGVQRRYLTPIRFFFIAAIVCLAGISFAVDDSLEQNFRESEQQQARTAFHDMMVDEVTDARDSVLTLFNQDERATAAMDSLLRLIGAERGDTLTYMYFVRDSVGLLNFTSVDVPMSAQDVVLLPMETLLDTYEIENFWHRLQLRQIIKISRDGDNASRFLLGQSIWAILFIVPFLALWLKLLYIRRQRYYIEHFLFTLHVHTFVFVLYALFLILYLLFGWTNQLLYGIPIVAIYLYAALYRVYGQGWFKTLVKYGLIVLAYQLLLSLSFLLTVLISVFLY